MSSMFPSSAIGLPQSLKYDLPPSLSDSARSYSVNVAPDGVTSVAGPATTATPFVANSTGLFGNFTSQVVVLLFLQVCLIVFSWIHPPQLFHSL